MCFTTMDTDVKRIQTVSLRKKVKLGSKLRWRLFRVTPEEDEAYKPCRASPVRATIRRCPRQQPRRAQLARLAKVLQDVGKKQKLGSICTERHAVACGDGHPSGAMAPQNTTQYLMNNVYEDMTTNVESAPVQTERSGHKFDECSSPRSVYTALDCDYESCLAFQQRDFEEEFGQCW